MRERNKESSERNKVIHTCRNTKTKYIRERFLSLIRQRGNENNDKEKEDNKEKVDLQFT